MRSYRITTSSDANIAEAMRNFLKTPSDVTQGAQLIVPEGSARPQCLFRSADKLLLVSRNVRKLRRFIGIDDIRVSRGTVDPYCLVFMLDPLRVSAEARRQIYSVSSIYSDRPNRCF